MADSYMSTIKKLTPKDYPKYAEIAANAYPGMDVNTDEAVKKLAKRLQKGERADSTVTAYGLFRKNTLLGVMRLYDFTMTMYSTHIPVGGIGLVAVDLAHKKEKVCKEMIDFYIRHYRKRKFPMLALYPFRPDFYRKMGFGYGTKINRYRIKPADLPADGDRANVVAVDRKKLSPLVKCYDRRAKTVHGMMKRNKIDVMRFQAESLRIFAYRTGGKVQGYIIFSFKKGDKDSFILNDIEIRELVYENRDALMGILSFLHSQADQVRFINYNTQDNDFHFLPHDPRNHTDSLIPSVGHESSRQGVGIMYRVIDTPGLFRRLKDHDFGGQTCKLKITVRDSFYPEHNGSYSIRFKNGKAAVMKSGKPDVEITLDVAEYSSLVMGSVPFKKLHTYGLADISDKSYLDVVNRLFLPEAKPICMTDF